MDFVDSIICACQPWIASSIRDSSHCARSDSRLADKANHPERRIDPIGMIQSFIAAIISMDRTPNDQAKGPRSGPA